LKYNAKATGFRRAPALQTGCSAAEICLDFVVILVFYLYLDLPFPIFDGTVHKAGNDRRLSGIS